MREDVTISATAPSPMNPPPGCRFHTRCPYAEERCRKEEPALRQLASGHAAACHFAETLPAFGSIVDRKRGHAFGRVEAKLAAYKKAVETRRQAIPAA